MENGIIPFNGRFTIESPRGGHKTFQIKTQKRGKLQGERILSLFRGRENTDDSQYQGFAFVKDDRVVIWNRFKTDHSHQMYVTMLTSLVQKGERSQFFARGYRLLMETRCRKCNRPLTNPESIKTGIGPECRGGRIYGPNQQAKRAERARRRHESDDIPDGAAQAMEDEGFDV